MPKVTIALSSVLIVLGVVAYGATGAVSVTALIPTFVGLPVLVFGVLAVRQPQRRALWMHLAVGLMFLGLVGTMPALPSLIPLLSKAAVDRPTAVIVQLLMLVMCLGHVVLSIRSFVIARRNAAASS